MANKYSKQRHSPSKFPNATAASRPETAQERKDRVGSKRYPGDKVTNPNSKTEEVDTFARSSTAANRQAAKKRMKAGGRVRMDGTATPR